MPAIMFLVLVFPHWIELEKIEVWNMLAVLMSRRWFSRSLKFHGYEILCNVQTEQSAIHAVSISIWLAYAWYDAESLSVIKRIIIQNQKHQDNSIYWQFNNACMSYKTWSGLIFIAIFFFLSVRQPHFHTLCASKHCWCLCFCFTFHLNSARLVRINRVRVCLYYYSPVAFFIRWRRRKWRKTQCTAKIA